MPLLLLWTVCSMLTIMISPIEGVQQITNPHIVEHPEDQFVPRGEPATLNCKAEGEPPPVITWYRDGQQVITAYENLQSHHRMLLPSGQLLVMKVLHSKNRPDVGLYYCNATNPETKVSVVSRTAKLEIAVIRDDFREQPKSIDVALGVEAALHCKPPKGEPEPRVRWEKDGRQVELDDRITVDEIGSLRVKDARKEDAGIYVCIAFNIAGARESHRARLAVKEKPVILDGPKNAVVTENGDVLFQCRALDDPDVDVIWKKKEGEIATERLQLLPDRGLRIQNARATDEGTYVCRLQNSVGWQEAEAKLTVQSRPSFVVALRDKTVSLGRRVSMRCEMTGNPVPVVLWSRVSNKTYMFPNRNYGRFRVTEDGTLIIESVQPEDSGEYSCQGLSSAGTAYAKARLDIKDVDTRPPPIVSVGPQNQTLPADGTASLPCVASGEPAPGISWLKNGHILSLHDSRFTIVDSGTLQISNLQQSDSGLFTCKAVSETGETTWTAALVVEPTTKPYIIFHRTPDPSTFPGAPSKPVVSEISETSMRLTWKAHQNSGASTVVCFMVESFSHEAGEGWVVIVECVAEQMVVVRSLLPNTSYLFLVRAKNSHGLSLPSPITFTVKTKGESIVLVRPTPPQLDLSVVVEKLSTPMIRLSPPEVLSATAVKLTWDVQRNQRFIEGFYVKFRPVADREESSGGVSEVADQVVEVIQSPVASMYVLSGLHKYAWYEVCLQPFYASVKGAESNVVRARTLEDVPSVAPRNIKTLLMENDTLVVTWDPPAKNQRNGILYGYKIYIFGNESKFNHEIQVNSTAETVHYVYRIFKDVFYKLYMSTYNRIGEGPQSEVIYVGHVVLGETKTTPLMMEPWFIATLVVTIGAALWMAVCIFSVWIYRRRMERKKGQKTCKKVQKKGKAVSENSRFSKSTAQRNGEDGRSGPNQIPLLSANNGDISSHGNQAYIQQFCFDNRSPCDGDSKINGSQLMLGHTYQTLDSLQHSNGAVRDPLSIAYTDSACTSALPLPPSMKSLYGRAVVPSIPYSTASVPNGGSIFNCKATPGNGVIPNPEAYMIQHTGSPGDFHARKEHQDFRGNFKTATSDSERLRGCNTSQPLHLVEHLHPIDNSRTYHSDRVRPFNSKAITHCPVLRHQNIMNGCGYGVPVVCSNCEQRQYDSPCDRTSSLDSQTGTTPFSNGGYHDPPPAFIMPDRLLLSYDMFNNGHYPCEEVPVAWGGAPDRVELDCLSAASSGEVETDFASAVTRVAELSGLTLANHSSGQGTDIKDGQKAKKSGKHRQRAPRPSSPCSTDSSYSAAPRRPYPKSERKKHLQERDERTGTPPANAHISEQNRGPALNNNRRCFDSDGIPSHNKTPSIPYPSTTYSRVAGNIDDSDVAILTRPSPMLAFDTRNAPIV